MTTEGDGNAAAAAAALFTLHSSPLVTPEYTKLKLSMPTLHLSNHRRPLPVANVDTKEAAMTLNIIGRPRSTSWDPTFSSTSLLSFMNAEPDASAAGTLCALMKSSPQIGAVASSNVITSRPRSQSTSATLPLSQQQIRANRGLRPRSLSVTSNSNTVAVGSKKQGRPRATSQSSRASVRSRSSNRGGRSRALSMDSYVSAYDEDEDDEDEDDDVDERESIRGGEMDDLTNVGKYSPDSRRRRIERFLEKRRRRIWKKRIKYDVRKNFADSRLRVKGRFVRKEDEEQLREYLEIV